MRVTVAVCTWRRPELLDRLLPVLTEQLRAETGIEGTVLVIDNDDAESARDVCARHGVAYDVEPSRGVGHARNHALARAAEADVLIFFDDDQIPRPEWLGAFLTAHRSDTEALWVGSVQPDVEGTPPAWARDWWPWTYPEYPDGTLLPQCNDGNLLLPRKVRDAPECRYADDFLSGMGQDTELTSRLHARGVRIRYAAQARALETIPAERMEPDWIVRRAHASALAMGRIWLTRGHRWVLARSFVRRAASASGYAVLGVVLRRSDLAMKSRRDRAVLSGYREALTQ